jgi:hypothetical protein
MDWMVGLFSHKDSIYESTPLRTQESSRGKEGANSYDCSEQVDIPADINDDYKAIR